MNAKTLLTDLRLGLAVVLAAQSTIVDTFTSWPAVAKVVSSAFGVLGVVASVLAIVSEQSTPPPPAPATSGNVKP